MTFPLHCGRLDDHDTHDWRGAPFARPRRTWHCTGRPLIEGGWSGSDSEDDAADERADRERREIA